MTLGPALLFLWATGSHTPVWLRPAIVYGRVPLFYYVLHFPLIHLIAVILCYVRYGQIRPMFESPTPGSISVHAYAGVGPKPANVYLFWFAVVLAMYPLCRWFAELKQRRADPWLSYFWLAAIRNPAAYKCAQGVLG